MNGTGDTIWFQQRLKRAFPHPWGALTTNFLQIANVLTDPNVLANASQNIDAMLLCGGYELSTIYGQIEGVEPEIYLQTATGVNLDLIALDYFGDLIQRQPGQSDASFRAEIEASFFNIGPTYNDIYRTLTKLVGSNSRILQQIPQEQAWNVSNWGWNSPTAVWCASSQTAQVLAQMPPQQTASQQYIVNSALALTRPAGVRIWGQTTAYGPPQPAGGIEVMQTPPKYAQGAPYLLTGVALGLALGGTANAPYIMSTPTELADILNVISSTPVMLTPSGELADALT